jgi:hypothetical protein
VLLEQVPTVCAAPPVQSVLAQQLGSGLWTQDPLAIAHIMQPPHAAPAFCQAPLASHICGCDPLQVFAPGEQTPMQVPLSVLQTNWQAVPLFCQAPLASQVCG